METVVMIMLIVIVLLVLLGLGLGIWSVPTPHPPPCAPSPPFPPSLPNNQLPDGVHRVRLGNVPYQSWYPRHPSLSLSLGVLGAIHA